MASLLVDMDLASALLKRWAPRKRGVSSSVSGNGVRAAASVLELLKSYEGPLVMPSALSRRR